MNNEVKKNTIYLSFCDIFSKGIQFILLIVYSYFMSISEYGVVDLIGTISSLLLMIIGLNISESMFRNIASATLEEDLKSNFSNAIFVYLLSSVIVFPIILIFKNWSLKEYIFIMYLYIVLCGFFNMISLFLKAQNKIKLYMIYNVLCCTLLFIFGLVFVISVEDKVYGYIYSMLFTYIIMIIIGIFFAKLYKYFSLNLINCYMILSMLKYCLPLILNNVSWWLVNLSDRLIIIHFLGEADNGIMSMAHKFPSVLSLLFGVFLQAMQLFAYSSNDLLQYKKSSEEIIKYLILFMALLVMILNTFIELFTKLFLPFEYYDSYRYVGLLSIGIVFYCLSTYYGIIYGIFKKSVSSTISTIIGGVLNFILCILLIKPLGLYASPISTLISYVFIFVYRYFTTQKLLPVKIKPFHCICLIPVLLSIIFNLICENTLINFIINIFLLIILLVMNSKNIKKMISIVSRR